jgi:fused signal recognition particle receptor
MEHADRMERKKTLAVRLREIFGRGGWDASYLEELEDALIEGDLGPQVASETVERLKEQIRRDRGSDRGEVVGRLRELLAGYVRVAPLEPEKGRLNVFLVLGVNGVGKTTTIAKLAAYLREHAGVEKLLLSAADTFRAAAIEQLGLWGERLGIPVIRQSPGADPGAVVYDSISSARARGAEVVLVDTAGRMHTKEHLVKELAKVDRIIQSRLEDGRYRKVLVLDATTGQNALRQAEVFHQAVGVDCAILAKYDSTARGGIVIPICRDLGIPFSFLGVGEKLEDLVPFDPAAYVESLVSPS